MTADADGRFTSTTVVLKTRPQGALEASDLRLANEPLPPVREGQVRLAIRFLSVDPFTRIFLDERPLGADLPGLPLGGSLPGAAVGEVMESRADGLAVGDFVEGRFGWRDSIVIDAAGLRRLDDALGQPQTALGILGLPGTTAYSGIIRVAGIQAGETAIISSAAGAVGLIAGQIAGLRGARVIGIAGGPEKCAMVRKLGFDDCIDYKAAGFDQALVAACPGGAQVYFDNVGGKVAMAAYAAMARGGRVALCGLLSLYQGEGGEAGDLGRFMRLIMSGGLKIQAYGTIQICPPEALSDLSRWMKEGRIHLPETVIDGLAAAPQAFADMLAGSIRGKLIVRI